MTDQLKQFIEEHKDIINDNTLEGWKEVYMSNNVRTNLLVELTESLLQIGIDPSQVLEFIPGYYLFQSKIKSYTVPDTVIAIHEFAFMDCKRLESITIGRSTKTISENSFEHCMSLKNIDVAPGNSVYTSIQGDLYSRDKKTLIKYCIGKHDATFNIPEGVETIDGSAFRHGYNLVKVYIPNSVTTIEPFAFSFCKNLNNVEIGNSVERIDIAAFWGCTKLKSVVIPTSIVSISPDAFDTTTVIYYKGTMKQWRDVLKSNVKKYMRNKIICTDGEIN